MPARLPNLKLSQMQFLKPLLSFLILFVTTTSIVAQTSDKVEIKNVFDVYKSAILNDQADKALNAIDNRTISYYKRILADVKSADSSKISAMSLIDKITVLGVRARATKQEIMDMTGTDVFIFSIKNGMVGKNSVVNNSVGEITIDKNFAKGELLVNGQKTPVFFHFYKENNAWKLNLTELFNLGNSSLKQLLKQSGKTENESLMQVLSMLSGKTLSYEIWNPVE
jgi:hypothetical protein